MLLHKTPMAYARAVTAAARGASGIMIQFPFYAGIQALMDHSGLAGVITKWFVDIANVHTFPLLAFLSSAVINFAVPSGGGHWVVQGPFVMPVAQALGADLGKSAMAIAYGEAWTNRMLGGRNHLIFPNLFIIDLVMGCTIRTFYPDSPDYMDITAWQLVPNGEDDALRRMRMSNFLTFWGPAGLATPDDVEA